MRYIFLSIFIFVFYTFYGQTILKDSIKSKCNFGLYPNFLYYDKLVDKQTDEFAKLFSLELRPYVSYHIYSNLYVGGAISYEFFKSNFYKKEKFVEVGIFSRFILPYTINKKFLKKLNLYFELGYYKTNFKVVSYVANTYVYKSIKIEEDFIISKKLDQSKLSIPIGIKFQAKKHLYIDFNWQKNFYIDGASESGFMGGVGFNF